MPDCNHYSPAWKSSIYHSATPAVWTVWCFISWKAPIFVRLVWNCPTVWVSQGLGLFSQFLRSKLCTVILLTRFYKLLTTVAILSGGTFPKCLNGTTPLITLNFHSSEQPFEILFYILTVELIVYHVTSGDMRRWTVIGRIFGIRGCEWCRRYIVGLAVTNKANIIT